jgi:hypothetical protein
MTLDEWVINTFPLTGPLAAISIIFALWLIYECTVRLIDAIVGLITGWRP